MSLSNEYEICLTQINKHFGLQAQYNLDEIRLILKMKSRTNQLLTKTNDKNIQLWIETMKIIEEEIKKTKGTVVLEEKTQSMKNTEDEFIIEEHHPFIATNNDFGINQPLPVKFEDG